MPITEVLVVGGGTSGAATAAALARAGIKVILLDRGSPRQRPEQPTGERLAASARPLLAQLGFWDAFQAAGHAPSDSVESDWGTGGSRTSLTDPYGPGWLLDRSRFDRDLLQQAESQGVQVRTGDAVLVTPTSVRGRRTGFLVTCRSGHRTWPLTCRYVVDASGRRRTVAGSLGHHAENVDTLVAFTTHLAREQPSSPPRVRAHRDGWWWYTSTPEGGCVLTCFTDPDLPSAQLLREAARDAKLPAGTPFRRRPAGTSWLAEPGGHGWVAVGDAALTIDPLAGQGIVTALHAALVAAQDIVTADGSYRRWLTSTRVLLRIQQRAAYFSEHRWPSEAFWSRRTCADQSTTPQRHRGQSCRTPVLR